MYQFEELTKQIQTKVLRRFRLHILCLRRRFGYAYYTDLKDCTLSFDIIQNGYFFNKNGDMF